MHGRKRAASVLVCSGQNFPITVAITHAGNEYKTDPGREVENKFRKQVHKIGKNCRLSEFSLQLKFFFVVTTVIKPVRSR